MWKYNAADIGIDDDPDPLCHCVIRNSGTQCISLPFILHFVSCGNANVCECKWWVVESGTVGAGKRVDACGLAYFFVIGLPSLGICCFC